MAAYTQAGGERAALPAAFTIRVGDTSNIETLCAVINN
jgi:hypothetical protein